MALKYVTQSTSEPVGVEDLKDHLRIDSTSEDILLRRYIQAATRQAEAITHRQLCTCTYMLTLDEFPGDGVIELPRPPLASTTVTITYITSTGGSTTLSDTAYDVDDSSTDGPACVRLGYEQSWPSERDVYNAVQIQYEAGYPLSTLDNLPTVPEDIKLWIQMRAGDYYEQREGIIATSPGSGNRVAPFLDALLSPYIIHNTGGF